jgi:hypothetical protein
LSQGFYLNLNFSFLGLFIYFVVGFKIVILGVCITGALSSAWEACTMLIGIQKCSFIMLLEALLHSFPGGVARAHGGDSVCRQWAVFFFLSFFLSII